MNTSSGPANTTEIKNSRLYLRAVAACPLAADAAPEPREPPQ
jgi:hypothetical protein